MTAPKARFIASGLFIGPALLLAGCGSSGDDQAHRVGATVPSVTYSYQGDQLDAATNQATDYCQGYGQEAKLRELVTREGLRYATYVCR